MPVSRLLAVVAVVSVAALTAAAASATASRSRQPYVQRVGITIRAEDRVTEPNIALAPGMPVRITVNNYTHQFHTFTVPGLGLSKLILPARGHTPRQTTFTFTPHQWGAFTWHCLICPSGMHGRPHTMGGTLYLIINPSALP